jgi:hypothetical protein
MPEDAEAWRPALEAREEQPVHFQQRPLLLANPPALGEQDRHVMEVAQPGGPRDPLQAVEGQGEGVVLQRGIQEEGGPLP